MISTKFVAPKDHSLLGEKLFQKRARAALPILVRQSHAQQPITYKDLATELEMPNPRNLNFVLGAISRAMNEVGDANDTSIPPIQFIVVRKGIGLPGDAVGWYARGEAATYASLSRRERRMLNERVVAKIGAFPHWLSVLEALELRPIAATLPAGGRLAAGTGESPTHKALKEVVARDPGLVGYSGQPELVTVEHEFPSGDAVDVLLSGQSEVLGVEVKAAGVPVGELVRGLFQCVKYRALIAAESAIGSSLVESRAVLAIGGPFPDQLRAASHTLGVEVFDCLTSSEK